MAEDAGVSVQSVHLAGPKASLLLAAYEVALVGDEGAHSYLERPAMQLILAEPDSAIAVAAFVDFLVQSYARAADIWAALRAAADVLGFLTWEQSYLYFVQTRGWSVERYGAWMLDGINRMILGDAVDQG